MTRAAVIVIAGGIIAGALWWSRRALELQGETETAPDLIDYGYQALDYLDGENSMNAEQNQRAFLNAIRYGEGTSGAYGFQTKFGGSLFGTYANHPAVLGWPGVKLTAAQCAGAGFGPGCVSTAAGAYQINKPTWLRLQNKLSLPDFSPGSQDAAAIELIKEKGAFSDIRAGRVEAAISKIRKIWASLPGAGYGQHEVAASTFKNQYLQNGGALA